MSEDDCVVALGDLIEKVRPPAVSPCERGESVEECVRRLLSMAPFYGETFAVPDEKRIITRWGEIVNSGGVPAGKDVEYVLGLSGESVPSRARLVVYSGGRVEVKEYENRNGSLLRLGENYLWYDYLDSCYVWKGLRYIDVDVPFFIWNSMLVLGRKTKLPKKFVGEITGRGGEFRVRYVVPGVPEDVKFLGLQKIAVGRKVMKFVWEEAECGITVLMPYFDGLYRVFIPYGAEFDPWSPDFVRDVDEEYVVGKVFSTGFSKVPRGAHLEWKFTPFVSVFAVKWGNYSVEVRLVGERVRKICVSLGDKKKCVENQDMVEMLLSLSSPEEVLATLSLL